jgi:glycosyltransferase involved in cell wall biosynthesis
MIKISYAITTHNEWQEIDWLLSFLLDHKDDEDEIVIVDDGSDHMTWRVFDEYIHDSEYNIKFFEHPLNNNFSVHKNFMNDQCTGDWIFNIDADEKPHENLIANVKLLIETNPEVELYWVPRINTVDGMTQEHAAQFGWRLNDKNWVNYPDPQQRIYKNASHIRWKYAVHERLEGAEVDTLLPREEEWSIYHHKTLEKQIEQNKKYQGIKR